MCLYNNALRWSNSDRNMSHTLLNKYNKIVVYNKIYNLLLSVNITQQDKFHQNDFLIIGQHYYTHH